MENLIDLKAKNQRRRHYETTFILVPTLTDAQSKELVEKNAKLLEDHKSIILRRDDWGKKRMAYSINKHAIGTYIYFRHIGTNEALQALERSLKLDASVLRYLSISLSEPLSQSEIDSLVERAPKEPSSCPSAKGEEDDFGLESAYS